MITVITGRKGYVNLLVGETQPVDGYTRDLIPCGAPPSPGERFHGMQKCVINAGADSPIISIQKKHLLIMNKTRYHEYDPISKYGYPGA